jgi:hypothetical protein
MKNTLLALMTAPLAALITLGCVDTGVSNQSDNPKTHDTPTNSSIQASSSSVEAHPQPSTCTPIYYRDLKSNVYCTIGGEVTLDGKTVCYEDVKSNGCVGNYCIDNPALALQSAPCAEDPVDPEVPVSSESQASSNSQDPGTVTECTTACLLVPGQTAITYDVIRTPNHSLVCSEQIRSQGYEQYNANNEQIAWISCPGKGQ